MRIRDGGDEEIGIGLTSLIDVVFLLLTFFMLATSFIDQEQKIDIDLPEAISGSEAAEVPDEVVINVLEDGRLVVSGHEVDDAGLVAALGAAAAKDKETPVTIRGDRGVRHEHVVHVMDRCGLAGLSNLSVGTTEQDEEGG